MKLIINFNRSADKYLLFDAVYEVNRTPIMYTTFVHPRVEKYQRLKCMSDYHEIRYNSSVRKVVE